jgi:hypothetical protein
MEAQDMHWRVVYRVEVIQTHVMNLTFFHGGAYSAQWRCVRTACADNDLTLHSTPSVCGLCFH